MEIVHPYFVAICHSNPNTGMIIVLPAVQYLTRRLSLLCNPTSVSRLMQFPRIPAKPLIYFRDVISCRPSLCLAIWIAWCSEHSQLHHSGSDLFCFIMIYSFANHNALNYGPFPFPINIYLPALYFQNITMKRHIKITLHNKLHNKHYSYILSEVSD